MATLHLPADLDGDIDQFIDELSTKDETEKLAASGMDDDE